MGLEIVGLVPVWIVIFCSSLIVNVIQLLLVILVLPFSRRMYRILNAALTSSFWSQMIWVAEQWGRLKVVIYTDPETWSHLGKENALWISNHRSDVDWLVGWVLAQRTGRLGTTRALMKMVFKYLPVIGWSMWFSEYIFLARDFAKDQKAMKAGFERLRDFPIPFWVALFVEGTRFTPEKLLVAQEFARSAGVYVPKNTLVPRTKGFVMSVEYLRSFVPVILDTTVMVPEGKPAPTFSRFIRRQPAEIHVLLRRVPMDSLPADPEGVAKWCRDNFIEKDGVLEEYKKINSFDPKLLYPTQPSQWTTIHLLFWSTIVYSGLAWVAHHFLGPAALSWQFFAAIAAVLALMGALLEALMSFTKSEYSTPLAGPKRRAAVQAEGSKPHKE